MMSARIIHAVLFAVLRAVAGCKNQDEQAGTNSAPSVVQAAPVEDQSAQLESGRKHEEPATQETANLVPEAAEALAYVNAHFVDSPDDRYPIVNQRLVVVGNKLVLSYDAPETGKPIEHDETIANIADLNAETVKTVENSDSAEIEVRCNGGKECVRHNANGKQDAYAPTSEFIVGNSFGFGDAHTVASYFKRLLLLTQGKPATAVEHEPTEEEAVGYVNSHMLPTATLNGGLTAYNRSLAVEGGELRYKQDVQQVHFSVIANLAQLDPDLIVAKEGYVVLSCLPNDGGQQERCFMDNYGNSSPYFMLNGFTNSQQVAKMLRRIILLHRGSH